MALSIIRHGISDVRDWDKIWSNCRYSTYFHSREWAEIWQKNSNGMLQPEPRILLFSDGKKVLLPLSVRNYNKVSFLREYASSPAGTYGGWISEDVLASDHCHCLTKYLLSSFPNLRWRLNPFDDSLREMSRINKSVSDDFTYFFDLSDGFGKIVEKWSENKKNILRKINKAKNSGVTIRRAGTINDWKEYYNVYQESLRRWGASASSTYPWKLFRVMHSSNSEHIILWLADFKGRIISGALCFYSGNHAVYWHGAALSEYFSLRPVNLLFHEIVEDACKNGYLWFDFNPSGGHKGVEKFKRSLGAIPLASPVVFKKGLAYKSLSEFKSHINRLKKIFKTNDLQNYQ